MQQLKFKVYGGSVKHAWLIENLLTIKIKLALEYNTFGKESEL